MDKSIAITGIGAVTPLGCSRREIWQNFQSGESALKNRHVCDTMDLPFGSVNQEGDWRHYANFDFLEPAAREQASADAGLNFGMAAAEMALQESGFQIGPDNARRVGVVLGSSKGQLQSLLKAHTEFLRCGPAISGNGSSPFSQNFRNFPGSSLGSMIAMRHRIEGPVLNYPAACSTGINSVAAAMNLLRDGIVDAVITGSCESSANALTLASFENMGALSRDLVRPFHKNRNGFNAGEGAGAMILEREEDARARGAKIYGRLVGWDFRTDAHHLTAVERGGSAIEYAIKRCMKMAGWDFPDVQFINAHGTGTDLNDYTEATVIERLFGQPGPYVASLKAHMGHLLGASAGVELVVTLIALENDFLFPTLLLDEPDPEFSINFVPAGGIRMHVCKCLKLSYGFGGHIGVLAVERD
jgi:3-oxoacyl-[acyl-carrier-protein] synthase II